MIKIRFWGGPDNIEGFMVWGHSGYAPPGRDIVCAAVSAICTGALIGLVDLFPRNTRYIILPRGLIYCKMRGRLTASRARQAQLIFRVAFLSLKAVQRSYGEYIDLVGG